MIATLGKAIKQSDLESLATAAGDVGCPPTGQPSYRFGEYEVDSVTARRWLTELSRLRGDVLVRAVEMMAPTEDVPFEAGDGVLSGPWMVPSGHGWFYSGGSPALSGIWAYGAPNYGRTALDVKLWSRGVITPFRVLGAIAPAWDYMLIAADDETGYQAIDQTEGAAEFAFSRPVTCAGYVRLVIQARGVASAAAVVVDTSGSDPAPDGVVEISRTETDNGDGTWDVDGEYQIEWGTCTNPTGNRDLYDPESGPETDTWTVVWSIAGGGYVPAGYSVPQTGFFFAAHYGEPEGDYAAVVKPAVSEDVWYVSEEEPALTVASVFRKGTGFNGLGPAWNYGNVAILTAEALPTTPETPAETHWSAKLWPGVNMSRTAGVGGVFMGQDDPASGQTIATPHAASDGLWTQGATETEVEMDGTSKTQPGAWSGLSGPCAVDYVQIERRKPYGASPAIEVQIGCWQGAGEGREFVPLVTAELPSGETRKRVAIPLLPVLDNLSIGYTHADAVTVRLGNWKPIGSPAAPGMLTGTVLVDGTPCGLVNDLEALCGALTGA